MLIKKKKEAEVKFTAKELAKFKALYKAMEKEKEDEDEEEDDMEEDDSEDMPAVIIMAGKKKPKMLKKSD